MNKGNLEVEQIVSKNSESFEDLLCGHWEKISDGLCPKGMSCTQCLEAIIKTLAKRFDRED